MNRIVSGSFQSLVALMLVLAIGGTVAAADPSFIKGFGNIDLDLERWTFTARTTAGTNIDTITDKKTGKRIIFVYLDTGVRTAEGALALIPPMIRGPNDLQITATPKVEEGVLAGGVLANYEAMRIERVAIVVRANPRQATVFISTADNPMEDADLVVIKRLVETSNVR